MKVSAFCILKKLINIMCGSITQEEEIGCEEDIFEFFPFSHSFHFSPLIVWVTVWTDSEQYTTEMRVITGAMFHIVTAIIIYLNFELCITHVVAVSDSLNENVTIAWNVGIENSSESTIPSTPHLQVVTTSRSFNTSTTTTEAPYLKTSSIERTVADVEKDRLPLTTEAFLPSNPVMTESSVTPSIASNTSQPQPDMAAFSTTSTAATTIMGVNTSVVEIAEPPVNIPEKSSGCTTSKRKYRIFLVIIIIINIIIS